MSEAAKSMSASINTNRNCTIEINNYSKRFFLVKPKVYMCSGHCVHTPKDIVHPTVTQLCSFNKFPYYARGAVGVLTYNLSQGPESIGSQRVAIMFSVPFDYILYKNWFGVGVFDIDEACDKDLFKKMYYDNDFTNFKRSEAGRSGIHFKTTEVILKATMANMGKAIIEVELFDV